MCAVLALKYAFLYMPTQRYLNACVERFQRVHVNVIYKVDVTNRNHNYPPLNSSSTHSNHSPVANEENTTINNAPCSTPVKGATCETTDGNKSNNNNSNNTSHNTSPHRTFSHYGYNCPLTSAPNIQLHPANQSIWLSVAEQREKVVSFIDLTALSFAKRKMLNVLSGSAKATIPEPTSHSYVSSVNIQLESQSQRKQRNDSMITNGSMDEISSKMALTTSLQPETETELEGNAVSCQESANDSMEELISQFCSKMSLDTPTKASQPEPERDDESLYPSSYISRSFLPDNHAMAKDTGTGADKPEAEQVLYQNGDDSGLGLGSSRGAGRRQRLITTSNESSTQEAEAYSQGKHIRLTLSSSPEAESQLKSSSIEILINVSLRNSECVQTVHAHEQEFRSKLEKVIDDEINYISQQLAMQHRAAHLLHSSEQHARAPLATPTPSTSILLQRSNSAPALCHTYSYVALGGSELPPIPQAPPSTPTSSHCWPEPDELQRLLSSLEIELQNLLNSIIRAHALHNRAIIYECRTRISQLREDISGVVNRARAK